MLGYMLDNWDKADELMWLKSSKHLIRKKSLDKNTYIINKNLKLQICLKTEIKLCSKIYGVTMTKLLNKYR